VRNIFKYYTAYKLMLDLEETQKRRVRRLKSPAEKTKAGRLCGTAGRNLVLRQAGELVG